MLWSDLIDDNARWYDPTIGRFIQADTVVPGGVQGYDRYAYANNSPVLYNDPTGHYMQPLSGFWGDVSVHTQQALYIIKSNASWQDKAVARAYVGLAYATQWAPLVLGALMGGGGEGMVMSAKSELPAEGAVASTEAGAAASETTAPSIRGAPAGMGEAGGPNAGKSITAAQRLALLAENKAENPNGNYWCENCGYESSNTSDFDIDHIVPKSQSGTNGPANTRVLCVGCNRSSQNGWPPLPGSDWATKYGSGIMK